MRWGFLVAASFVVVGCSSSSPATTPTSVATTASTTTTTIATTTTVDRLAQIEAIYQDLEERRLDALFRGDREAYRALHVDNGYLERSMELFDVVQFDDRPAPEVEVLELIRDGPECIAVERVVRLQGEETSKALVAVLELREGLWLLSFVGSGWTCDGPYPFES